MYNPNGWVIYTESGIEQSLEIYEAVNRQRESDLARQYHSEGEALTAFLDKHSANNTRPVRVLVQRQEPRQSERPTGIPLGGPLGDLLGSPLGW